MPDSIIHVKPAYLNMGPTGASFLARDFFKCYLDFEPPSTFPMVQFFLLCRAIEHALKVKHYENKIREWINKNFKGKKGHNLKFFYDHLKTHQILTDDEYKLLCDANDIYSEKDFEYLTPNVIYDMGTAYRRYPELKKLQALTKKLIDNLCVQLKGYDN